MGSRHDIKPGGAAILILALSACGGNEGALVRSVPSASAESETPQAPAEQPGAATQGQVPAIAPSGLALATRILRDGASAIPRDPAWSEFVDPNDPRVLQPAPEEGARLFQVVNVSRQWLSDFLAFPDVDNAVQFGCVVERHEVERRLVEAMELGADEGAVLALATLVRVRAPRHIESQWRTFWRLDLRHRGDPGWETVLVGIQRPFRPDAIDVALRYTPASDYGAPRSFEWAVRAAGVTRHAASLPRLIELSRGRNLDGSLAAERSLEDFPGEQGDAALAECLLGWRYDAFAQAGYALCERNPGLLERTLSAAAVPEQARREVGLLLARVGSAAAVPHLCAMVGNTAIVDGQMFDAIEKLATAEQWPLVEALQATVRGDQYGRAGRLVETVRARLGR